MLAALSHECDIKHTFLLYNNIISILPCYIIYTQFVAFAQWDEYAKFLIIEDIIIIKKNLETITNKRCSWFSVAD